MANWSNIGKVLVIIGSIVWLIGFVYGSWIQYNCAEGGCGDIIDKQINYPIRYPLMVIGITMIVTGIVMWAKARVSKIKS